MSIPQQQIETVRAFNRDYTRRIGVLSQGLLDSPYSLTQVRVMFEVAHRPGVLAGQLARGLGLDRGYLSRILKGFEAQRLLAAGLDEVRRIVREEEPLRPSTRLHTMAAEEQTTIAHRRQCALRA